VDKYIWSLWDTVDKIQLEILPRTIDVMGYVLKFFFRFLHFIVQPSMGLEQGSVS
jgi:hypothetical protein